MIITDSFVFVHLPKTGGTFVAAMLRQAHGLANPQHEPSGLLHRWLGTRRRGILELSKHGTCRDIPRRHAAKQVVATIRSPYDRYVSQYEYGWWRRYPTSLGEPSVIRRLCPSFPNIGFEDFVRLSDALCTLQPARDARPIGPHARRFVEFFASDPPAFLDRLTVSSSTSEVWSRYCVPDRFLRTERLNEDLHDWLVDRGYPPEKTAFIPRAGSVYPEGGGRIEGRHWTHYYSPQLKDFVRSREWLLFDLFPEYDV